MPGDYPQPYDDDGKKHLETCKSASSFPNWKESYSVLKEFLLACAGPPIKKESLAVKMGA